MTITRSIVTGAAAGLAVLATAVAIPAMADPSPTPPVTTASPTAPATPQLSWPWLRAWLHRLTPEQRACLADLDVPRPNPPLTPQQRQEWREKATAAAEACGVDIVAAPRRQFWNSLTPEQQACFDKAGITRPVRPLSHDERVALRKRVVDAAQGCDITLPRR